MKHLGSNIWSPKQRAFLVVGALFCLCLSDSVGPRLLPLPNLSGALNLSSSPNDGSSASRTPNSGKEINPHIEMLASSQYRVRDRHYHVQLATHAPQDPLQPQCLTLARVPEVYVPLEFNAGSFSIPAGRAPPRSN